MLGQQSQLQLQFMKKSVVAHASLGTPFGIDAGSSKMNKGFFIIIVRKIHM